MSRTGSYDDNTLLGNNRHRQKSSVFRPAPNYELIPGMKTKVTDFRKSLYMDRYGNKLIYQPTGKPRDSSV